MKLNRNPGPKRAFLPPGALEAFQRTGLRTGGLGLTMLGGLTLAALITADPRDPSANSTGFGPVRNVLGRLGAWSADLLWQLFGWGSLLLFIIPVVWGLRILVTGQSTRHWRWRLAALPFGLLALAVTLGPIDATGDFSPSAGGALGLVTARGLESVMPDGFEWIAPVAAALSALILTIFSFGISAREWAACGRVLAHLVQRLNRDQPDYGGESREPSLYRPVRREPHMGDHDDPEDDEQDDEVDDEVDADVDAELDSFTAAPAVAPPTLVVERRAPPVPAGKREVAARQGKLDLGAPPSNGDYDLPPLELLKSAPVKTVANLNQDALAQNARMLETVLDDFGVSGQVVKVRPGPVVTLYELEPAPGTKTSRVIGLADDIARSMSALAVRIATIPGRNVIGIELPNSIRETVFLRELLAAESFEKAQARLSLALGKDIGGTPVQVDLARMPHLLIAGTTGSGKSVAVNTMILSLLYRLSPKECRMIMIDPKMLELSVYDGIPHLLAPVVTEPGKAVVALKWAVREMEDRYRAMSQLGVRNIQGYNQRLTEAAEKGEVLTRTVQTGFDPETGKPVYEDQILALAPLPFIVVIVDEMADLMLVAGKDIESAVQRLAQMARAAGIHLIMATQRPSVDVITGTIKANFPTRISFQVTSKIDSRTILGEQGAEQLLGQGDMLYMASGGRITRVHGPFVSDREVEQVVEHLRAQGEPDYIEAVTEEELEAPAFGEGGGNSSSEGYDEFYDQALALVAREGKASTSFIQRHFQIGYNRAARIIERMEADGVVSKPNRVGKREVLVGGGSDH